MVTNMLLGKDLKPGMLIKEGLVVSVDLTSNDSFWKSPHISLLRAEDAHYGLLGAQLDPEEEFEIVHSQGTREYQESLNAIFCELVEAATMRVAESQKVLKFINRYGSVAQSGERLPYKQEVVGS